MRVPCHRAPAARPRTIRELASANECFGVNAVPECLGRVRRAVRPGHRDAGCRSVSGSAGRRDAFLLPSWPSSIQPVRGRSAISSTWHRPTVRGSRAHPARPSAGRSPKACARGSRAVALREVEEMARTPHPPPHSTLLRTPPSPRPARPARTQMLTAATSPK